MNEATLTQLKIIVERAVRPVRASTARKRKVREELLAHVSGVFAEESAKLGDDRAALEQTALRFGDPVEVTAQLQGTVSAGDGIHGLLDKLWFPPREHRVLRYVTLSSLILMIFFSSWYVWVQICTWAVRASQWPPEEARLLGGPVLLLDWFFFAFSAAILIWTLVRLDREMDARIRCHQEWTNLRID